MTLNHLNLTVTDPIETSAFLAKYFRLQPAGGNAGMQMLRDDGGMVLTLMKARPDDRADGGVGEGSEGGGKSNGPEGEARTEGPEGAVTAAGPEGQAKAEGLKRVRYPSSFHIGFIQPSPARVDEINKRLRDDGFNVDAPAHLHGSWTFYFQAPGGFTVEVLG
jgi:catechol 2,3-dioxygenase-like lactoylglutathione lyase family enzyme